MLAAMLAVFGCQKKVVVSFTSPTVEIVPEGGSVEVNLASNGDWNLEDTPSWISVSPMNGNGNTTLTLTAESNITTEPRSVEITAVSKDNSATLTVTQGFVESPSPFISLSPKLKVCDPQENEFEVGIASNIEWSVLSIPNWVSCSPESGVNNTTVRMTLSSVWGEVSNHEGFVVIGNTEVSDTLHIIQTTNEHNDLIVTPISLEMGYTGETKTVSVAYDGDWTAVVTVDWITLNMAEGQGNADVAVTAAENPNFTSRDALVEFRPASGASVFVSVTQEGSPDPHFLTVSPFELAFGKDGGTAEVNVGCDTDWTVNLDVDWVTLSALEGTGDAQLTVAVEPNLISESRTMSFTIVSGDLMRRVRVDQEPGEVPLFVEITPDTVSVTYTGGIKTLNIVSNTSWRLETSTLWIMMLNTSGTGDGTRDIIVDSNPDGQERYGVVRVMHGTEVMDEVVVAQEAKPFILETDITEINVPSAGGTYTIHVTSTMNWTVGKGAAWLNYTPESGSGNGNIEVIVEPNLSTRPRNAEIHVTADNEALVVISVKQSGN